MDEEQKMTCALCGYTADGRFEGDICPKCGLSYWKCNKCNFIMTTASPPDICPNCHDKCTFMNITCYTPDCGGPEHIDPRLV
jgi:rubrerythrin